MCPICRGTISGCPDCDPEGAYERKAEEREFPGAVLFVLGIWVGGMTFALLQAISPF